MRNPYKVFHSSRENLRKQIHCVLVRPELSENVGSTARALANMGILGTLRIVGSPSIINERSYALAKHAAPILENAIHFPSLNEALTLPEGRKGLSLASTARVGSANRPHPLRIREAAAKAVQKLEANEVNDIFLVFGPEGDGLENAEIDLCDWVVTIPSHSGYRSLNLAQAILVFSYEVNSVLIEQWDDFESVNPGQRDKLVTHFVKLAEAVGFVLPGDPYKMRPRLEEILSQLPRHIREVKTLHGLLDQAIRSVQAGERAFKGRYRNKVEEANGRLSGKQERLES